MDTEDLRRKLEGNNSGIVYNTDDFDKRERPQNIIIEVNIEDVILLNGYIKHGYGYRKITEEITHWITLFDDKLQMYGYESCDANLEKVYDTGIISIENNQLQTLIYTWLNNYN